MCIIQAFSCFHKRAHNSETPWHIWYKDIKCTWIWKYLKSIDSCNIWHRQHNKASRSPDAHDMEINPNPQNLAPYFIDETAHLFLQMAIMAIGSHI